MTSAQNDRIDKFCYLLNMVVAGAFVVLGIGSKQPDVTLAGWLGMLIMNYAPSRRYRR